MVPRLSPEPFWRRTPPGLLPVCLGLLGCGLAWRLATRVLGAPEAVGPVWLGAAAAVLALVAGLYLRKVVDRVGALSFDLRMPAGRGAVSTGTVALMLAGAAAAPLAAPAATVLWAAGVILHFYVAVALLRELAAMPPDGRPPAPALLTPFAGHMAAPVGGVTLGFAAVSEGLFWLAAAAWLALTPFILRKLARGAPPPPFLRPEVTTLLTPPALGVVAYDRLHPEGVLATPLFLLALLTLFALVTRARWLTEGGWTLGWGAFVFPLAAFAWACLVMAERHIGPAWDWMAALALTAASLAALYVAWRTLEAAAKGRLAPA